jgi:hypothetical protein
MSDNNHTISSASAASTVASTSHPDSAHFSTNADIEHEQEHHSELELSSQVRSHSPLARTTTPPSTFDFPTLNDDGSVPDLTAHQSRPYLTPPAALSALGAQSIMPHIDASSESGHSIADSQYDMLDDLSEISNDDHDTASLPSNDHASDHGQFTPEYTESDDEAEQVTDTTFTSGLDGAAANTWEAGVEGTTGMPSTGSFVNIQHSLLDASAQNEERIKQMKAENELLDSYMSDDLDTPRQSAMPISGGPSKPEDSCRAKTKKTTNLSGFVRNLSFIILPVIVSIVSLLVMAPDMAFAPTGVSSAQREALITSLEHAMNAVNISNIFDAESLLPYCDNSASSLPSGDCELTPRLLAASPNYIALSLPAASRSTQVLSKSIFKQDGRLVGYNQTKLINGVYLFTIDPTEAYNKVVLNMITTKPSYNITETRDFGRRPFLSKTGTEVSKTVGKDIDVMRNAAKLLTRKLSTELSAGLSATKNVTSELAIYMSRELQVVAKAAVDIAGSTAKAPNRTMTRLSKDLSVVQKDVVKFSRGLSETIKSSMALAKTQSKALIKSPISQSRERLQDLKAAWKSPRGLPKKSLKSKGEDRAHQQICKHVKSQYQSAVRQLDRALKMAKRADNRGESLSKSQVKSLKKDIKQREKDVKRLEKDLSKLGVEREHA